MINNNSEGEKPLVVIRCITYNHEPYIRDALEGFVMQKTDFPFVAIVHDDASTDGTAAIIREYAEKYPDIIKPIYETENQYSKRDGSLGRIMNKACEETGAKYIAFCEGDDYWIDPLKLQKQVDFLESHPDYGMVYSDFNILDQTTGRLHPSQFKNNPKKFLKNYPDVATFVLRKGYVAPPSWMFRRELNPDNRILSLDGTYVYFTHFLATTKVYVFDETMVTYRKLEESASHSRDVDKMFMRADNILDTQMKLIDKYNLGDELKRKCIESHYKSILASAIANKRKEVIEVARKKIIHKSAMDKLVFIIHDINPYFMKLAYLIRNYIKKYNKSLILICFFYC